MSVTDLELERAKQLVARIRWDSLRAWVNQSIKNETMKADILALPEALKVVMIRLELRMNDLSEMGKDVVRARAMARSLLEGLDVDVGGDTFVASAELKADIDHRMATFSSTWRSEILGWPE